MKNSSDIFGNRTHDVPGCNAVPQPTAQPRASRMRKRRLIFRFPNMLSKAAIGTVESEVSCFALLENSLYSVSQTLEFKKK